MLQGWFKGLAPIWTAQINYSISVTGHLKWKFSDYMLVLCQKLHISTYDVRFDVHIGTIGLFFIAYQNLTERGC